jgi:uncharacterized protein YacL
MTTMNWEQLGKQLVLSVMVSLLVFLMISVAFAQVITSTLLTAVDANSSLTTIIFLGFIVALLVALLVNLLISEAAHKLRVFYASLFGFVSVIFSYCDRILDFLRIPKPGRY